MGDVIIYTRNWCGFCTAAKNLLTKKGVAFTEFNASDDPSYRGEMMQKSGRNTFPQIFIKGEHVGGCDDIHALDDEGKLDPLLAALAQG